MDDQQDKANLPANPPLDSSKAGQATGADMSQAAGSDPSAPGGPLTTGPSTPGSSQTPSSPVDRPPTTPQPGMGASTAIKSEPEFQQNTTMTSEPGKKSFSKVYLLVIGVILLLGGLAFLLWKFWPSGFLGFGKPGEIVWWGLWEEESIVAPLIEEYQEKNPNITITYKKQSPQDYRERLTNSLAKGEGPDVFRFHNTWLPMLKNELDTIPSSVMTSEEFSNIYYPVMSSDLTSGSGLVGLPLGYDALTLFINEDIFSASGKVPPKTWDDFRKVALELTLRDERGNVRLAGAAIGRTENVDHWEEILATMMLQNGVDLTDPTGQLVQDAVAYYRLFWEYDKIWDNTLPPSTIAFANGKTAMYFGPTWRAFEIHQMNPDLRFRTVPVPQLPKDDPNDPDISYATYWIEGVWARSEKKEESWEFLKFISSKESLEKLYQNASNTRLFGEPYPRTDMADLIIDHPLAGSVVKLAPYSESWYLASRTFDGPTGINTQMSQYFEDVVNAKKIRDEDYETLSSGVTQVLSQYGLVRR